MPGTIDLTKYKVVHGDKVYRCLALIGMSVNESQKDRLQEREKPKFISILIINEDGNIEILNDEAWRFQFVPDLVE